MTFLCLRCAINVACCVMLDGIFTNISSSLIVLPVGTSLVQTESNERPLSQCADCEGILQLFLRLILRGVIALKQIRMIDAF